MKLTEKRTDELEPDAKEYFAWDDGLPGFGVRARYSTVRRFQYSPIVFSSIR
ncbi:MAG: hypothetical protein V3U44_09555 [Alphaproteobacteria bacterium]